MLPFSPCLPSFETSPLGTIPLPRARAGAERLAKAGLDVPAPTAAIALTKVTYPSTDEGGHAVRLSGLLAVPAGGATRGTVLYYHGTTADRSLSPSRFTGASDGPGSNLEIAAVTLAFAGGGYAVAIPDYLGLGDDPGPHPYPAGDLNSKSGLDLLKALKREGPLYVSGYSEGGAAAMWGVRHLEETGEGPAASAPMSGPYDLSGVTAKSLLRGGDGYINLGARLYLTAYTFDSARRRMPGIDLRDYFAPSFASYVPFVMAQDILDAKKGEKLVIKAFQLGAFRSIIGVTTARFREALQGKIPDDPILAELRRDDTYDWSPKAPMLLPFLTRDPLVVPENTTHTIFAMRARGVGPETVRPFAITSGKYNHATAAAPAFAAARAFFDAAPDARFDAMPQSKTPDGIAGRVRLPNRTVLPSGAEVRVRLQDETEGNRILAQDASRDGAYRLVFDPNLILPSHRYTVAAEVVDPDGTVRAASKRGRTVFTTSDFARFDLQLPSR